MLLVLRWTARISTILVVAFSVLLLLSEILSPHSGPPTRFIEWAGIGLLVTSVAALIYAWNHELTGSLISLLAISAFVAMFGLYSPVVLIPIVVPAALFLLDAALSRQLLPY